MRLARIIDRYRTDCRRLLGHCGIYGVVSRYTKRDTATRQGRDTPIRNSRSWQGTHFAGFVLPERRRATKRCGGGFIGKVHPPGIIGAQPLEDTTKLVGFYAVHHVPKTVLVLWIVFKGCMTRRPVQIAFIIGGGVYKNI